MTPETKQRAEPRVNSPYEPKMRMRISLTGLLRNAAEELQDEFDRRERIRKSHTHLDRADEEDGCECDVCSQQDWAAFYADSLRDAADNLAKLDADPSLIFEWADFYALHGVAAAHALVEDGE